MWLEQLKGGVAIIEMGDVGGARGKSFGRTDDKDGLLGARQADWLDLVPGALSPARGP